MACSSPSQRFDRVAGELSLSYRDIPGKGFVHRVYFNSAKRRDGVLHVYLGGDGTPWIGGVVVASDPTPRNPLGLRLMALDDRDSLYLGRPCYHGVGRAADCDSALWTSARYSETVADSMAEVLRGVMDAQGYEALSFIGFSGGGALAMILAERFAQTRQVVTLAGNLDTEAWVKLHHYDALSGSLNPREQPTLREDIQQYHLAGGEDGNIPSELIEQAIAEQPRFQFLRFEHFTHGCCWEQIWPDLLSCLAVDCDWQSSYPRDGQGKEEGDLSD
ncbi:MAG: alpha/beta hydrolase [Candidatus Thiodiazotropha sp.]